MLYFEINSFEEFILLEVVSLIIYIVILLEDVNLIIYIVIL